MKTNKENRNFLASRFVLTFDGDGEMGTLQTVEGGAFKSAGVLDEKVGMEGLVTRHPGRPQYEDITIQVGMAMAKRFWNWLDASLRYQPERKDGSIIALDFDNKVRWERKFKGALITEIGFPALDGGSTEAAYLTVKFAVEELREERPPSNEGGRVYNADQETKDEWTKQQNWLCSNFTLRIDNFGTVNHITSKIEAFAVKQAVIDCPVGKYLETTKEPGRIEFPNLSVTVNLADSRQWMEWYQEFVRKGNYEASNEKTGHITYLARDVNVQRPLLTLDLFGLGITSISAVKYDAKQQQVQKVKIDMYMESMGLTPYDRGVVGK